MKIHDRAAAVSRPGREPAGLPIVVARGEVELGPDKEDALVEADDTAVVESVLEVDGHAYVADDSLRQLRLPQDVREHLPRVLHRVQLEEVVLAPVARHLKLRPQTVTRSQLLGHLDGLDDVVLVVVEAH